jgi:hypothetical protein
MGECLGFWGNQQSREDGLWKGDENWGLIIWNVRRPMILCHKIGKQLPSSSYLSKAGGLSLSPCVWAQPPFAPLGLCLEKVLGFFLLFASFLSIVTLNRLLEMFIISLSPILL